MISSVTISDVRNRLRIDLKDIASAYRLTNAQLDRAIQKALNEFSLVYPDQKTVDFATTNGSSDIDITSLGYWISIDKLEYPIDETPKSFVRFQLWGFILTMLDAIGDGSDARVYYSAPHIINDAGATLSPQLIDTVILGASAYAVLSLSQNATDKANTGGSNVDRDYLYWAVGREQSFQRALKQLNKRKIKTNQLYLTDE